MTLQIENPKVHGRWQGGPKALGGHSIGDLDQRANVVP